jgi:hypothetical protein
MTDLAFIRTPQRVILRIVKQAIKNDLEKFVLKGTPHELE